MFAVKGISFPALCCNKLRMIDGNSTKLFSCLRNWICVQSVWECWERGCVYSCSEIQREDQPTHSTHLWKALPSEHLWAAAAEPLSLSGISPCWFFRRRLPKIPRALIWLIVLTHFCIFIANFSSLFGLSKTRIFR